MRLCRLSSDLTLPQSRLSAGDELRLKHTCAGADSKPWAGSGVVVRLCEASEEVALELRGGGAPPVATTVGYTVEFVWKSATFDRMQRALKAFAVDEACVSGYLYHRCGDSGMLHYYEMLYIIYYQALHCTWDQTEVMRYPRSSILSVERLFCGVFHLLGV